MASRRVAVWGTSDVNEEVVDLNQKHDKIIKTDKYKDKYKLSKKMRPERTSPSSAPLGQPLVRLTAVTRAARGSALSSSRTLLGLEALPLGLPALPLGLVVLSQGPRR